MAIQGDLRHLLRGIRTAGTGPTHVGVARQLPGPVRVQPSAAGSSGGYCCRPLPRCQTHRCRVSLRTHFFIAERNRLQLIKYIANRWGGCMVAMVSSGGVENFIQHLKDHFYRDLPAASGLDLDTVLFPTQPGDGAAVFQ
jgi:hypothetical protein